jgi:hypothetical protein
VSGRLTETVIAGGVIYLAGTARSETKDVPAGPWWSDGGEPENQGEPGGSGQERGGGEPETPQAPPRSGAGSGADAWRAYAEAIDVEIPADAGRDDIIAAVDARG